MNASDTSNSASDTGPLASRRGAILATDGVEEVELVEPRRAVERAGAETRLLSLDSGEIQAMNADVHPAGKHRVDETVADASVDDFDALLLPGGTTNPDHLRRTHGKVRVIVVRAGGRVRPGFRPVGTSRGRDLPRAVDARRGRCRA